MTWEQYEVWSVDIDGHEELIDTTQSFKEAQDLAGASLTDDVVEVIIYRDVDGDIEEVERVS